MYPMLSVVVAGAGVGGGGGGAVFLCTSLSHLLLKYENTPIQIY